MSKRLILMRHAESMPRTKGRDFERTLSFRGEQQAEEMGDFLLDKKWKPDWILVSPAARTRQTAEILTKCLSLKERQIQYSKPLYGASGKTIAQTVRKEHIPDDAETLLVLAHNPGITEFAVSCSPQSRIPYFPPSGIACFELAELESWSLFTLPFAVFSFHQMPRY